MRHNYIRTKSLPKPTPMEDPGNTTTPKIWPCLVAEKEEVSGPDGGSVKKWLQILRLNGMPV